MMHNLKLIKLFISGMFYLLFSDHSWPQEAEIVKSEVMDKGGQWYWKLKEIPKLKMCLVMSLLFETFVLHPRDLFYN